ncbi:oxidoreductase [Halolactibacillus miurensis]|uniref:Oxidoreductase n=1 Tax=Halolactibacillus miurensis TaxID=306541 RepID=A0A1I6P5T8_9BACI|nr:aldo/keto reductase [Halolactibacillus miurensis]GEM03107.1 oxidoreductase [Halolactibacillus miurensis]SFS35440.1 Predicted oxidoreductase [Halolactibacillus miurensis]
MDRQRLGQTSFHVSRVGFGAWQLGNLKDWGEMDDKTAVKLVHEAIDLGCNFFDTAPNYGLGKSETILGEAFKGRREEVVINSKCGHHIDDVQSFDRKRLVESVDGSLKRLQTNYLDSLLLHNPPFDALSQTSEAYGVLEDLKRQGKIKAYGASVDTGKEVDQIITETNSDVIEVMFNIFHQEPLEAIKRANDKGVGVIAKVPLDSGWLSGKYGASSTFTGIRSRWSEAEIRERSEFVQDVRKIIGDNQSMASVALQYILSFDAFSSVIPGARNSEQLRQNMSATHKPLNGRIKQQLHDLYETKVKQLNLNW